MEQPTPKVNPLSKHTDDVEKCHLYFTRFLPTMLNKLLIDDLEDLSVCFEIAIEDSDLSPWRLDLRDGCLQYVGHEGVAPVCQYRTDAATLLQVISAKVTPQEAFFDLKIQLEGDLEMGLRLSTVLAPFFSRYAYPL